MARAILELQRTAGNAVAAQLALRRSAPPAGARAPEASTSHSTVAVQRKSSRSELLKAVKAAIAAADWQEVAVRLNGFNKGDIQRLAAGLSLAQVTSTRAAVRQYLAGWPNEEFIVASLDVTSERELGNEVAKGMTQANQPGSATSGVHYAENYRRRFGSSKTGQSLTSDDYAKGYASPAYFERVGYWDWILKTRVSASEAVKAFLRGLTIAECNSVAVASEMNAVRAAIGDRAFDHRYGSSGVDLPESQRLHISQLSQATQPSAKGLLVPTAAASSNSTANSGSIGHRPVKVGEWYYFQNHPRYPAKNPGGSWRGENAIYLGLRGGQQKWSGFGAHDVTERYMLDKLVQHYNEAVPGWTGSPQTITTKGLLDAGGGLQLDAGIRLDPSAIGR